MQVFSLFSLILLLADRAGPRVDHNCPSCLHREEESHRSNTSTPVKSDKELQTEKGRCALPCTHITSASKRVGQEAAEVCSGIGLRGHLETCHVLVPRHFCWPQ